MTTSDAAASPQPSSTAMLAQQSPVATNSGSGNRAHVNMLRDELRDSVMEEERLLDRMAELSNTRSTLRVQVQQREADAEVQGIRRRKDKLEATRQAFQL